MSEARVLNRGRLARELTEAVDGEARFDPGSRAVYANDASIYRQVPLGVVLPRNAGDVLAALEVCRRHEVPVQEVRAAARDTLVLADGFSCRSQIEQGTQRRALHLAEALALALRHGPLGPVGLLPERAWRSPAPRADRLLGGVAAGVPAAGVGGILTARRR